MFTLPTGHPSKRAVKAAGAKVEIEESQPDTSVSTEGSVQEKAPSKTRAKAVQDKNVIELDLASEETDTKDESKE